MGEATITFSRLVEKLHRHHGGSPPPPSTDPLEASAHDARQFAAPRLRPQIAVDLNPQKRTSTETCRHKDDQRVLLGPLELLKCAGIFAFRGERVHHSGLCSTRFAVNELTLWHRDGRDVQQHLSGTPETLD